eukprot:802060-Amphidinium_carterae.2
MKVRPTQHEARYHERPDYHAYRASAPSSLWASLTPSPLCRGSGLHLMRALSSIRQQLQDPSQEDALGPDVSTVINRTLLAAWSRTRVPTSD